MTSQTKPTEALKHRRSLAIARAVACARCVAGCARASASGSRTISRTRTDCNIRNLPDELAVSDALQRKRLFTRVAGEGDQSVLIRG